MPQKDLEIVCPAGTPAAFAAAVEAGADAVYAGFRDETNARNFPGLNFDRDEMADAIHLAHSRGVRVFIAINTYPRAGDPAPWHRAIDDASRLKADAVILADIGLVEYAALHHPDLRRHLSVQASAANSAAIRYLSREFGIRRVVLPRVLTLPQITALNHAIEVETEVFAFGGLCVMAEGRCALSSWVTGRSPNMNGVCSPAEHVRYERDGDILVSKLNGLTVNRFAPDEPAAYPTLCKGRFRVCEKDRYLFEEPASLDARAILGEFRAAGVRAVKIEGRQRGRAYIARVIRAFREAIDALHAGRPLPPSELEDLREGGEGTTGAYRKEWR
ncbi:MAG: U32 family peptidase [Alphaproteobacteria bacterium]|nr:MAG: U32 family peptidase [Alphaproteobacteria bacterium]